MGLCLVLVDVVAAVVTDVAGAGTTVVFYSYACGGVIQSAVDGGNRVQLR